ncbi:MAG: hypothetical protein ABR915_05760 [Thermoguttaceae bacterium]|jgi:CDP-diglyceride synthetase
MACLVNRALSAAVAVVYLVLAYWIGGPALVVRWAIYLLLPMACIWFSEEMGSFTGVMYGRSVDSESPGCLVAFFGWVLLLSPIWGPWLAAALLK